MDSTGEVALKSQLCDIRELIEASLLRASLPLDVRTRPAGRQWRMYCDRVRLGAVFDELVANAKRATSKTHTELRIHVQLEPWLEEGTETGLRVLFADNGPGVNGENRDQIFDRFVSGFEEGHGLGLCIAQRVLRAHEGFIALCDPEESRAVTTAFGGGRGAVFRIFLPKSLEQNVP
jgi:signal transduction histidine kinase